MAKQLDDISSLRNDANLQAYFKLANNSDEINNITTLTDTAMTYGSSYGKFGDGATFNGSSSYINGGDEPTAEITGNMSVNGWFKSNQTTGGVLVCDWYGDGSAFYYGWQILLTYTAGAGYLVFRSGNSTSGEHATVQSDSVVNDDGWHMFTYVKDGGVVKMYIDGVLQADSTSGVTNHVYNANNSFRMGRGNHTNSSQDYYYNGELDDISIWNRVLTQNEITTLYTGGGGGGAFLFNFV